MSGQLHAEAITRLDNLNSFLVAQESVIFVPSGMNSVYTFGPTFRAEKSHTKRHLSEFYMVEAETTLLETGNDNIESEG